MCLLLQALEPQERVVWEGGMAGGQALEQLSILPSPGLELGRMGPCHWLLPWWAAEGLGIGRSRMGQNLPCARSCCWPRACISSLPPQPFSLYFYKYIYRNIYDAKCNRDETPHWPGSPCVSISLQTVKYLVPLGVLVLQDRVLGRLHIFLFLLLLIIIVLPFAHFLLGAAGDL